MQTPPVPVAKYSKNEELANSLTHGLGTLLGITALVVLLVISTMRGTASHIISSAIYGSSLIMLYGASTLYHSVHSPSAKKILQKIDHSSIFILIAGTYTPFTLVSLSGAWGWSLLGLIWGLAIFGVVLELATKKPYKKVSIALYLSMGWLIVIAIKPMIESVETGGLLLLLSGGIVYSLGVIFYVWKSFPFNHAIWHLFVLAGSTLQFFAVYYYVLPR